MPAVGQLKRLNDLLRITVVKAVSGTNIFIVKEPRWLYIIILLSLPRY